MNDPLQNEQVIQPLIRKGGSQKWKRVATGSVVAVSLIAVSAYAMFNNVDDQADSEGAKVPDMRTSTLPPPVFALSPEPEPVQSIAAQLQAIEAVAVATAPPPETRIVYRDRPIPTVDKGVAPPNVDLGGNQESQGGYPSVEELTALSGAQGGGSLFGGAGGESVQVASNGAHGVATVVAGKLNNLGNIITRGAVVPCALGSRLVSQIGGVTTCRVTYPVRSADGTRVLIEQGSIITAEYGAGVAQGMNRIAIVADRLRTPDGVVVNLQSGATDQIGAAGAQGSINNHFWQRVGGALLVSLIDSAVTAATQSDTNANVVVGNAGEASSEIALELLRASIGIPATVSIHQGARINFVLSSDLDFTGVL